MNWPHSTVDRQAWQATAARLQAGELSLLGLWGEPGVVHMAVLRGATAGEVAGTGIVTVSPLDHQP